MKINEILPSVVWIKWLKSFDTTSLKQTNQNSMKVPKKVNFSKEEKYCIKLCIYRRLDLADRVAALLIIRFWIKYDHRNRPRLIANKFCTFVKLLQLFLSLVWQLQHCAYVCGSNRNNGWIISEKHHKKSKLIA